MVLEGHCRFSSFKGLKARYLREGSLSLAGQLAGCLSQQGAHDLHRHCGFKRIFNSVVTSCQLIVETG